MRLLFTILGLAFILFANAQKITREKAVKTQLLTEAANFRIDSVVYYCNPFITNYFEPIERDYKPAWLQASLISRRPDLFEDYITDAIKYSHSSISQDTAMIAKTKKDRIETISQLKFANKNKPLSYTLGEIWFTELEKNVTMVAVSHFFKPDSVSLNINLEKDSLSINSIGAKFYILSNGIVKNVGVGINEQLQLDNYRFWAFNDFKKIMSIVPTYKRSFIVNGHRIFETVKNTHNGPVVVDKNGNIIGSQPWYLKYWWALAAGLAIIALLVLFVRRKSKK